MSKYIAVDIGASSGRIIVFDFSNGIVMTEISRFSIEIVDKGQKRLNLSKLVCDIEQGIKKATSNFSNIVGIGVDTWGVDFVCLDKNDEVLVDPMFYRDKSFINALNKYKHDNNLYNLYQKTGIQIQAFNTYFQFESLKENYSIYEIEKCLLLPDYLNFILCGEFNTEYCNLTSTQCLDLHTKQMLHEKAKYFPATKDSRVLGKLNKELANEQDVLVISVASHDTASAHIAIPKLNSNTAFLSSGTWSLLGVEVDNPVINRDTYKYNFTNEGCYNQKYRFQKNIMGLWMIVNVAREIKISDYEKLSEMAEKSSCNTIVNVNDKSFFNPKSMIEAIDNYIFEHQLEKPENNNDLVRIIYRSLAVSYEQTLNEIETILNRKITELIIVGGGANAQFMNNELNKISSRKIKVFPYECSALGNALVQAVESGFFQDISHAHRYIENYLEIKMIGEVNG